MFTEGHSNPEMRAGEESIEAKKQRLKELKMWAGQGAGTSEDRELIERLEAEIAQSEKNS